MRLRSNLEVASNLALLTVCLWSGYALYSRPAPAPALPQPSRPSLGKGEAVSVDGLQLAEGKDSTVLLFVRSSCQFCTASMPFYARLRQQMAASGGAERLRLVIVTTDDRDTASSYLAQHRLTVDQLLASARFPDKVWATPTLVVVSSTGVVKGAWTGQLNAARELEVLETMGLS